MQRGNAEKRVAANAEHARDRRAGGRVGDRQPANFCLDGIEGLQGLVERPHLGLEGNRIGQRHQRAADIGLIEIHRGGQPRLRQRRLDRIGGLRGVLGQRVDPVELRALDRAERLIERDEHAVCAVGRRLRRDRGARRPEGERRRSGCPSLPAAKAVRSAASAEPASACRSGFAGETEPFGSIVVPGCGSKSPWRSLSGLAGQKLAQLAGHLLLVDQLAAGDAVELGTQRRNAILVGFLKAGLAGRDGPDQVVTQHQVAGGQQIERPEQEQGAAAQRHQRGPHREAADLLAAGDDHRMRRPCLAECRRPR